MIHAPKRPIRPTPSADELARVEAMIQSTSRDVLCAVASDRLLTEDLALALVARRNLPKEVLEVLAKNSLIMVSRKLQNAVVRHPRTPRHVSIPLTRHLYTFDLMQIALAPAIAADIKMMAEQLIEARLEKLSSGERLTLARRGSTRLAAALLFDAEPRIIDAALDNTRLTEAWIVQMLRVEDASSDFVIAVCRHPKWSLQREIRIALICHHKTPIGRVVVYAGSLPSYILREILRDNRANTIVKAQLLKELRDRARKQKEEKSAD